MTQSLSLPTLLPSDHPLLLSHIFVYWYSAPRRRYAKKVGDKWGVTNDGGDFPIYALTLAGNDILWRWISYPILSKRFTTQNNHTLSLSLSQTYTYTYIHTLTSRYHSVIHPFLSNTHIHCNTKSYNHFLSLSLPFSSCHEQV